MSSRIFWLFSMVLVIMLAIQAGCQQVKTGETSGVVDEVGTATEGPGLNMANPAAVYCEALGYTLEPRENEAGMDADCVFPDGSECLQWDFLAGRCGNEHSFCSVQGGEIKDVGTNIADCVFEDGSTCDEFSFSTGECQPGDNALESIQDDQGQEEEGAAAQTSAVPVVGWMGYVQSTPAGAQYDDYIVVLPEGEVGQFGIEGQDDVVKSQIEALRDQEQPGKVAHFWGSLECGVMDYGGCQLLVERLRVDGPGPFFEPDQVDGWQGTLVGFSYDEPGAPQLDDAFILDGDYPVQYGIDSAIAADSGDRDLAVPIEAFRDSGETIKIWGELNCGVPDAGGCHIEVYRIEAAGQVYEITPAEQ